ncbi:helix-turn-helix transcriptional regulator [Paenibacillus sp. TRM 82003]|nr:helix-turn-helix transcriptional regulator [Paenibacillus sp. TRM 82003]
MLPPAYSITADQLFGFTPREREIAEVLMSCPSISEIAGQLHMAEITVKKHLGQMYRKAEVKGKTELVKKLMNAMRP